MPVKPIPESYHTVTPYLVCAGAEKVVDFMIKAFGAKSVMRTNRPDGKIAHADLLVGDSHVMLGEANEQWPPRPAGLFLYVPDADATYKKAIGAGGKSLMEPADQFHGDRMGGIEDPAGNQWWVATRIEDVSDEEIQRRAEKAAAKS
jgi:PhnB protein